jgi:hypothetical protein
LPGRLKARVNGFTGFCQAVEKREIAMNCGLTEGNEGNKGNPMGPFLFTSLLSLAFV